MDKEEQKFLKEAEEEICRLEKRIEELAIKIIKEDYKFDKYHTDFYNTVDELDEIHHSIYNIKRECMRWYKLNDDLNEYDKEAYEVHYKAYLVERMIWKCQMLTSDHEIQCRITRHN